MVKFINSFFEKYKNLTPPNYYLKKTYQEVIEEMFGVMVDEKDITVRNKVILLTAPSALKSEIFLRKKEVLEKLHHNLTKTSTTTIIDLR